MACEVFGGKSRDHSIGIDRWSSGLLGFISIRIGGGVEWRVASSQVCVDESRQGIEGAFELWIECRDAFAINIPDVSVCVCDDTTSATRAKPLLDGRDTGRHSRHNRFLQNLVARGTPLTFPRQVASRTEPFPNSDDKMENSV